MSIEIMDLMEQLWPNPLTVLAQLAATAVLFILMYKLLWKPVQEILNTRSKFEQQKLDDAAKLKDENEQLNKEAHQYIDEAKQQAQQTILNAQQEGSKIKNSLIEQGKQQSQQIVEEAVTNMNLQKEKMLEDMHRQMVDVALSATEKMLQKKVDSQTDIDCIDDFIKEVEKNEY